MEFVRFTLRATVPKELWEALEEESRKEGETAARALMQALWDVLDRTAEMTGRTEAADRVSLESSLEEIGESGGEYSDFWRTGKAPSEEE